MQIKNKKDLQIKVMVPKMVGTFYKNNHYIVSVNPKRT